jgi:AcrR family transcriptional regulator
MTEAQPTDPKLDRIVSDSIKVFMTYGIKSITMDDIAKHLGMSKKTLYQHVVDKNDLVQRCVDFDCTSDQTQLELIVSQKLNAIEEYIAISKYIVNQIKSVHPSIFYDLEKYYPEAWKKMHMTRQDFAGEVISNNIRKGIEEGYFRDDLNVEIMTRLWVARMNVIFDPRLFPMQEFDLAEVYEQMFVHQIRGLASKKGIKYLDKHFKSNNKKS